MKPEEIGLAYDQITHLWTGSDFDRTNGIAAHHKALSFVERRGQAIDIGCGCTGRFIELLLERGFIVTGLDISKEMIRIARSRHPQVSFIHGDICRISLPDQYDFITAWDSIWHIPLIEQKKVITKIINALTPGGIFIFSFGATNGPDSHVNNFMGPDIYYSSLGKDGFVDLVTKLNCTIKFMSENSPSERHTYMIIEKAEPEKLLKDN